MHDGVRSIHVPGSISPTARILTKPAQGGSQWTHGSHVGTASLLEGYQDPFLPHSFVLSPSKFVPLVALFNLIISSSLTLPWQFVPSSAPCCSSISYKSLAPKLLPLAPSTSPLSFASTVSFMASCPPLPADCPHGFFIPSFSQ